MEKPKKPIEPNIKDFPIPKEPNGVNYKGDPLYLRLDYFEAHDKWKKQHEKYKKDLELYEQIKLIRLMKNATEKYILKNYTITKK